jgi:hypothetical protein
MKFLCWQEIRTQKKQHAELLTQNLFATLLDHDIGLSPILKWMGLTTQAISGLVAAAE